MSYFQIVPSRKTQESNSGSVGLSVHASLWVYTVQPRISRLFFKKSQTGRIFTGQRYLPKML
jgi:hypothetical protein